MNLLDRATDWTNQTVEERAEACAAFLFTYRFLGVAEHDRTQNQIRARADTQREQRAKGTAMADRPTRNCNLCDDTGYKDYAGFAMDPCDHQQSILAADEVEAVGFLRDLADRLCKIPCVHHDGYDIDRLRELAVAMQAWSAPPLPDIGPDPFKGPREEYTLTNAEERLRAAFTVQQKGVPDQTALVWRCDLLKLFHELPRLRSIEEDWRKKRAAEPVSEAPDQARAAALEEAAALADERASRLVRTALPMWTVTHARRNEAETIASAIRTLAQGGSGDSASKN